MGRDIIKDWKFYLKEYTWGIILLATAIGLAYPVPGMTIKPCLPYLLMVLMFLSCINIEFGRAWKHLKKIRKVFTSLIIVFIVSPLLLLLIKRYFSDEIFVGLVLASVAPAGMSVVFLANLFGGSNAKSLVIMSLTNLLAIFLMPFLVLWFAHTKIGVDVVAMFLNMMKLVMLPLVVAIVLRRTFIKKVVEDYGVYLSILILFLLIIGVVSPVESVLVANLTQTIWLAIVVAGLVVVNFCLGYFLGLDRKAKITYAIANSYKNFTLTTVLALTLFNPTVALPSVIYTLVNNLLLIPIQWLFGKSR